MWAAVGSTVVAVAVAVMGWMDGNRTPNYSSTSTLNRNNDKHSTRTSSSTSTSNTLAAIQ